MWATLITVAVALAITGELSYAGIIGGLDSLIKLGAYYLHERAWNSSNVGRARVPGFAAKGVAS